MTKSPKRIFSFSNYSKSKGTFAHAPAGPTFEPLRKFDGRRNPVIDPPNFESRSRDSRPTTEFFRACAAASAHAAAAAAAASAWLPAFEFARCACIWPPPLMF